MTVIFRRLAAPALVGLASLVLPSRAVAQQKGAVELGGFLQLDRLDEALQTEKLGYGAGGRIGVFLSPKWQLEADASFTRANALPNRGGNPKVVTGDKVQISYYVGRLNYNIPFGATSGNAVILGLGAGVDRVDSHSDVVISPDVGLRTMFSDAVGLRFDVLGMISPNPASGTFKYPQRAPGVNDGAAYLSNFEGRVGLSFLFGNTPPFVPPPVVMTPPPPPPAPAPRVNQDSIDAANRMRDSIAAARAAAERALADARAQLQAPIYFDYDKSEIRSDAHATLDAKLPLLRANPSMHIRIEGNTDSRGSNEYNMALGLRRANAARRYLVSQGIDNSRIEVVSYGEERPVDPGTTEEAYAKNRRDDFVITIGADTMQLPR